MWFGQRERAFLWNMEGMKGLVWEAFPEFVLLHPRFVCNSLLAAASLWKLVLRPM